MSKVFKSIGVSAALAVASFIGSEAGAMPVGGSGKAALEQIGLVEQAQYTYGGQSYCWYDDGWNGPGWYVCGQYTVRGVGWGGGVGWHGWSHRGGGAVVRGGRTGGGRTGAAGRTGGGRTGASGRTGGGRTGASGRTGGGRTGASGRTGGGRTGAGGRTGGGRAGGGHGGGGRGGGGGRRSDIQLKHDVALIGRLENGLGFYRFSYNGSDKAYVGVIAQEVQQAVPEAVTRGSDGYLRVRYDVLGVKFQPYEQWLAAGAIVPSGLPPQH